MSTIRKAPAALVAAAFLFACAAGARADTAPEAAPSGKVNINQASAAQIAFLPRIGEKVAVRVVEYRKSHGPSPAPRTSWRSRGSAKSSSCL